LRSSDCSVGNDYETGGFNGRHRQPKATPTAVVDHAFQSRQLAAIVDGGRLPRTAL
jgi:hypothetical protein